MSTHSPADKLLRRRQALEQARARLRASLAAQARAAADAKATLARTVGGFAGKGM